MKSQLVKSLYFIKDPKMFSDRFTFGLQPSALSDKEYARMKRRISLKKDLGWQENEDLRQVIRKGDMWSDFPAKNYALVGVEFGLGDEKQRIDILYIRDDGGILPRFLETNDIKNKKVRILPKSGIIMDEDFKPQLVKAVRYLNECCGFWIRLVQIKAFVADDWNPDMEKYGFRMDFTDVQGICWRQDHGNDKRDAFN